MTALGEYPDLAITNFSLATDTFNVGASLEGTSCTVTNNGLAASQSVKMQFVAARSMDLTDPTLSQLSWATIPELQPGESFTATPRFNFGSGHDLGPFQIICYADSDALLLELAKDNNRVGIELQLQDRDLSRNASDLIFHTAGIVETEPYGELVVGETIEFFGVIKNIGNRHTINTTELDDGVPEQIMLNIYISTDRNWDSGPVREGGDEQIGWVRVDPLDVNESMPEIDKTARINTVGTFYIIVVIDNTRAVREQIELNNIWVSSVPIVVSAVDENDEDTTNQTISEAADLTVRDFQITGTVGETGVVSYGDTLTVTGTVVNIGNKPMSNETEANGGSCKGGVGVDCTRMKYYIYSGSGANVITEGKTPDEVKTEYGMKYWYYEKISALGVNETEDHTQSKTITSSYLDIGCYSVFAMIDYDNLYEEIEETNNFPYVDFEVNADTFVGPDLTGTVSWSVPSRVSSSTDAWPSGTAPLGARIDLNVSMNIDDLSQVPEDTTFDVRVYLSEQVVTSRCAGAGAANQEIFMTNRIVSKADFAQNGTFDLLLEPRLPVNVEETTYRIVVKLDAKGSLDEAIESNNIAVTEIVIDNVVDAENERAGMSTEVQVAEEYCTSIIKLDAKLYEKPSIGFWNLLHLSAKTQTEQNRREWGIISCIAAHFDVLAVVELEDLNALKYLAKRACDVTTQTDCECTKTSEDAASSCEWDWHISPIEAGRNGVCEYVGFVWNKANGAEYVSAQGYYNEGVNDTMKREPYGARFRMGNFDFTMTGVHQRHGGHVRYRQAEAVYSGDVFEQYQNAQCGSEQDVFYGGDMNLDASDSHWSVLYDPAYASLDAKYGVDPEQGTTLARTGDRTITTNAFDQVFWSSISDDAIDEAGAFDFTSPEIASIHGGETPGSNIYTTVSDHIPVYVIFKDSIYDNSFTDADTDVTCNDWVPWPAPNSTDPAAVRNRELDCPASD